MVRAFWEHRAYLWGTSPPLTPPGPGPPRRL